MPKFTTQTSPESETESPPQPKFPSRSQQRRLAVQKPEFQFLSLEELQEKEYAAQDQQDRLSQFEDWPEGKPLDFNGDETYGTVDDNDD